MRATAWREGKDIFRAESTGDAVRRFNRYSRVQVVLEDDVLAAPRISGVFDAGDTPSFVDAIQRYLPVVVDSTDPDQITLRLR